MQDIICRRTHSAGLDLKPEMSAVTGANSPNSSDILQLPPAAVRLSCGEQRRLRAGHKRGGPLGGGLQPQQRAERRRHLRRRPR